MTPEMAAFVHQALSGLANGGVYALIGLALVMIYQATNKINFAQGEMAMFSTYLCWSLIEAGAPYWMAFFSTVVLSFAAGVLIERIIIKPFENAPVLPSVIVVIGLMVITNSMAGWLFNYTVKSFPSPFPAAPPFGGLFVSWHELGSMGVTLTMLLGVYLFYRCTSLGLAMRAAARNPVSAQLVGIRVSWMLALGWGLAAAIGAVAGMMIAPVVFLEPNMMSGVLLYSFAGSLVGGINNPWGAVLGCLIFGVLENLVGAYVVGTNLKLTFALLVIIATLVVRPTGLIGKIETRQA